MIKSQHSKAFKYCWNFASGILFLFEFVIQNKLLEENILIKSLYLINSRQFNILPMGSTVRSNLPLSKWAFIAVFILVILMVCAKIFRIWPWGGDILRPSKMKDFYLNWEDTSNRGVIYYREIIPSGRAKLDVLLLHGMRFTSNDWVGINTPNILASAGYRVVALDLPGFGKSTYKLDTTHVSRGEFLWQFIKKTGLDSLVIVSPSMSGTFSLSYLADQKPAKGFVPVAVAGTDRIPVKDYAHFPPTLIVRGSRDITIGVTSTNILHENLPQNSVKVIDDAGHACYLDKPDEFHAVLLRFLQTIMERSLRE